MENKLDHIQYLVFRHTDMLNQQEHNTDEYGNLTYELINTWKMEPNNFGFFGFEHLPLDYIVYPVLHKDDSTARLVEYKPVGNILGSYGTYKEAVEAVKKHRKEFDEMHAKIDEAKKSFEELQKKNSLDERYKNHPNNDAPVVKKKVKTLGYLENLMNKAGVKTKEMHMRVEEARMNRNWELGNAEYINALINH